MTGTSMIAQAASGSNIVFSWNYWPADHQGPVWTYMSSCQGDCSNFDAKNAKWFKIDAAGYDNGQWAAAKLISNGASWTSTIPNGLAPGQYLVRHEIVALHSIGAPQFYPSCSQVQVTGSGTGQPSDSDLVAIPGLFDSATWPNIYTDFGTYAIPGPPVVTFGSGGSPPAAQNSPSPSMASAASPSSSDATSNPYATATTGTASYPAATYTSSASTSQASGTCLLSKSRKFTRRRATSKRSH